MKKFISVMLISIFAVSFAAEVLSAETETVFFEENFENYAIGDPAAVFDSHSAAGTISVAEASGNKVLYNSISRDGFYGTVSKKFNGAENYLNVFSLSFCEKDCRSNGTVIMGLYSHGIPVVKLVTTGENIEYVGKTENTVIIKDYNPNVWYDLELQVDTANKSVTIFADGIIAAQRLPYLNSAYYVDEFRSYGCYSPGYYLDNLKGCVLQEVYNTEIKGNAAPAIPSEGSAEYEYELVLKDSYGNVVNFETVSYSFTPASAQGISFRSEGKKAFVIVESTASEQDITISAAADPIGRTIQKTVSLVNALPEKLEITGNRRIGGSGEYSYIAKLYNTSGTLSGGKVMWSIENAPQNVNIDAATGVLTVTGELEDDGRFNICAECADAGLAEKITVVTQSSETYRRDCERFEAVRTALDNTLIYGTDPYNATPLIADGLEVASRTPALWRMPDGEEIAMSNLANQANLMMSLDAMTNLSGDKKYSERVREIYEYMWKHFASETNGLVYWGGHTTVNLKNLKKAGWENSSIHEFKNHMPYFEPFFKIDADRAAEMLKNIWAAHVADWKTLTFNRHAYYSEALNLNTTWNNPGIYDESTVGELIYSSGEMPFRNAANDLIYCAYTLFEQTGDETGLLWADRLLERYNALADPETKIGVYQFIQAQQRHDPMTELEPLGEWNKVYPTPDGYDNSKYGDRAKNQFEQQFVEEGIITEDERWKIREAYWVATGGIYKDGPLNDFKLAELFGKDSREGQKIMKAAIEGLASYARLAYIPETNKFRYLLSSGIDLTGYVLKTGGYYGDIGTVLSAATVSPEFIISYSKAYGMCEDKEEFADDKQEIWKIIRGIGKANDLGDLGKTAPGDNADINMLTSCAEPSIIIGLINIYRHTEDPVYLQLARRIGDNIVAKNFDGRFFVKSSSSKYVRFADSYTYVLLMLEAEICNMSEAVTEFRLCEPYFHCDIQMDNGWVRAKKFDRDVFWPVSLPSVYVREIETNTDYVELSVGETYDLGVRIIPDDASDKSITWSSSEETVADTDGTRIYAYSEGVTVLRGVSGDLKAKKEITIRVRN